jgi:hypothetical protein
MSEKQNRKCEKHLGDAGISERKSSKFNF